MGNKDWTSGANVGWVISTLDPKNLNYNAAAGTRRDIDLQPPFSDGNWHLVTITFNRSANQVISYLDGIAVMTSDISPSGAASLNAGLNTLVGSTGNGLYSATADIDDLGLWTRVLTPEEVASIYGAGLGGRPLLLAAGAVFTPALLPWLPGRAFSIKGFLMGLIAAAILTALRLDGITTIESLFEMAAWFFLVPALSAFLAMNFTGASSYTSLSGVRKEMRWAVPFQIGGGVMGINFWIGSQFVL